MIYSIYYSCTQTYTDTYIHACIHTHIQLVHIFVYIPIQTSTINCRDRIGDSLTEDQYQQVRELGLLVDKVCVAGIERTIMHNVCLG